MARLRKNRYFRRFVRRLGGARLIVLLRILELPIRLAARKVVSRVRRDERLVVFGAPLDRFADNAAYLFLRLSESQDLRCVWISGSRRLVERLRAAGYAAERRFSAAGLRVSLRAGWYVVTAYVSDVNRWTYDGAKVLNLWHGVPLKTIERDIRNSPFAFIHKQRPGSLLESAFADDTRPPDALLSTSRFISERCFTSAFAVPVECCIDVGYPRTDHFFEPPEEPPSRLLIERVDTWRMVRESGFVVGYFPTWRDDDSPFVERSGLSVDRLAEVVAARGGVLLFKPHFNTSFSRPAGDRIVVLSPDDDLNAYLHLCSALITDYSSVAFDFMLLNRPILYFVPDLDDYRRNRGLYFDPSDMMPGPLVFTATELYDAVWRLSPETPPDPRMPEVRARVWGDYSGDASSRLAELILADGDRDEESRADRPLRIMFTTPRYLPEEGGSQIHTYEVATRLAARDVDVTVVTTSLRAGFDRQSHERGVTVVRVRAWPPTRDYYLAPALAKVIPEHGTDLVHCQGYHTLVAPLAMAAALRARIPYVVTLHSGGDSSRLRRRLRPIQAWLLRPLLLRARRLIATSPFEAALFVRRLRLSEDAFTVIPSGVDLPRPASTDPPDDPPLILSIGRVEQYKGHHRVVEALPALTRARPGTRLRIVGTGPYEPQVREVAERLRVGHLVEIAPVPTYRREEMARLMQRAAVVTMLSQYESQGMAVQEALALGRPLVVARETALAELERYPNVRSVPSGAGPDEVAAVILELFAAPSVDPPAMPTWDECANRLLELYEDVLSSATSS
ncbi:MAG: CDP-glycerol glycerophosphotransferase family protein [Chloroflexota bacterium]|nr:CDP-glycerol glycerophosphotransferase family protein [Chloroflexota bacterium]